MRTLLIIAAVLFGVVFGAPSRSDSAAAPTGAPAYVLEDIAHDDCEGACLFCGHCSTCAHCNSLPAALGTAPPVDIRLAKVLAAPSDQDSRKYARLSGLYRPPRA